MFDNKNTLEEDTPFKIVHNYRSTSTRSSRLSKNQPRRKLSEMPIDLGTKKYRKMTENIEVENMLRNHEMEAEPRCALSEAEIDNREIVNEELDMEDAEFWGSSELEKVIPVELREDELDEESPLEMSSFKNLSSFEENLEHKNE